MAKRDVIEEYNGQVDESNYEEVIKRTLEIEEKYSEEFIRNGLKNVKVKFIEPGNR